MKVDINNSSIVPSNEMIERAQRELRESLKPYYKLLGDIQLLKSPPRILIDKYSTEPIIIQEETPEEKYIRECIERKIQDAKENMFK